MKNTHQSSLEVKKEPSFEMGNKILDARRKILFLLRGKEYGISSKCNNCGKVISPVEVIKILNDKKAKSPVVCSCKQTVKPFLCVGDKKYKLHSKFDVVSFIKKCNKMCPDAIEYCHPDIYHSAIFHFCTLKKAFYYLGVNYPYNEIDLRRIKPLIGTISLPLILQITGLSQRSITRLVRGL